MYYRDYKHSYTGTPSRHPPEDSLVLGSVMSDYLEELEPEVVPSDSFLYESLLSEDDQFDKKESEEV
ncbi:MAG: hypothetical protein GF404_01040 [candidate division Zixibacteria bacterium]|nr:hypothetical protein [candidate division Zixibacteria bacterium]